MRVLASSMTCLAVVICIACARAQELFPLAEGCSWSYRSTDGTSDFEASITGTTAVIDGVAVVRHNVVTGENAQVFDNFWTRDGEGRILLHGAHNPGWFWAYYDPPLVFVRAQPLQVGDEWCTEFRMYDYINDPEPDGPYVYCLSLASAGTITVPAGEFPANGIETAAPPRAGFDVFGARVEGDLRTPFSWLVDGVGEVRFTMSQKEYELLDYVVPTSTVATTWGAVKALFE
jgi:hypothetical protein